ncbi:uncharacterized protein MONBRDRAFT_7649 [Monosiga brevicollis MX1]|uniref:Uncharacterized protein n=1 Tax=Monosiga brevicollis TaxID=81824 RepID=A9UXW8_MONBE|nr:uncharacterized protein MONBRDRAFT_7649 [Monosiga brevicollis MX1]EDQ89758.1 predicted protein [Monosiga brevicollis MX1]|eukprot:XP_001745180.1 hypothetical protein [Monosiga brevicollis MX1]
MASSRFGSHAALCGTCALLVDYVLTYDPELALLIMVINKLHFLGGLSLLPIGDARPLRLNHAQGQAVNAAARGALTRRYSKVPAPHSRASLVPDSSKKSQPERDPPTLANNEVDESNTQDDVLYALTAVMGTYVGSASSPLHAQHGSVAGPSNLTPAENLSDTQAAVQDALDVLHEREDARRAAAPQTAQPCRGNYLSNKKPIISASHTGYNEPTRPLPDPQQWPRFPVINGDMYQMLSTANHSGC